MHKYLTAPIPGYAGNVKIGKKPIASALTGGGWQAATA